MLISAKSSCCLCLEGLGRKDVRSSSPSAQQEIRIRDIKAVLEGRKQVQVDQLFGVSYQTFGNWIKKKFQEVTALPGKLYTITRR